MWLVHTIIKSTSAITSQNACPKTAKVNAIHSQQKRGYLCIERATMYLYSDIPKYDEIMSIGAKKKFIRVSDTCKY